MAVNNKDGKGNPIDTTAIFSKKYVDAPWFKALQAKEFTTKQPFTAPGNDRSTGTFIEDLHVDEDVKSVYPAESGLTIGLSTALYDKDEIIGYWTQRLKFSSIETLFKDAYQELRKDGYPSAELNLQDGQGFALINYAPAIHQTEDLIHDFDNILFKMNLAEMGFLPAQRAIQGQSGASRHFHPGKQNILKF